MEEQSDKKTPQHARRRRGQKMTSEEKKAAQELFLKALSNTANVRAACMQAGIAHSTVYTWKEHDLEFGIRFHEANEEANWLLFGEAWRRAMQGEERYVVAQGRIVLDGNGNPLTYREKSDRLLELMLKARLPNFREKQHIDMEARVAASIQRTDPLDELDAFSNEQLAQLKTWLLEAKNRQDN